MSRTTTPWIGSLADFAALLGVSRTTLYAVREP